MSVLNESSFQEYFGETQNIVRHSVRKFVDQEIRPYIDEWEEAGTFPVELYKKAGDAGLLGIGHPESLGGTGGDII